jgi:hypothetical protein
MIKLGQLKRQCAIITADCDIRTAVWTLTVSKLVRTYVLSFNYRIVLAVLVMLMLLILILLILILLILILLILILLMLMLMLMFRLMLTELLVTVRHTH